MPMSFPTHQSVVNRAQMRNFRAPMENESEENYRQAFAEFMRFVDPVEASEISSGLGWDRQSPLSVLAGAFGAVSNRSDPSRMYSCVLTILPVSELSSLPESIVRGLRIGKTMEGKYTFDHDFYHGRDQERRYSEYYDPTDEAPALTKPEIKGKQIHIAVNPKEIKYSSDRIFIGGVMLELFFVKDFLLFNDNGENRGKFAYINETGGVNVMEIKATQISMEAFVVLDYTFEHPAVMG